MKELEWALNRSNPRNQVLYDAAQAVLSDRNSSYGPPEANFKDIADVWNWFLQDVKHIITPMDVAHMMILMKMARLKYNPNHRDSKVDVAGYAACAAECETKTAVDALKEIYSNQQSRKESPTEIIQSLGKKALPEYPYNSFTPQDN